MYLKFVSNNEYYITWNQVDFQLSLDVMINEVILLQEHLNCLTYQISVNGVGYYLIYLFPIYLGTILDIFLTTVTMIHEVFTLNQLEIFIKFCIK